MCVANFSSESSIANAMPLRIQLYDLFRKRVTSVDNKNPPNPSANPPAILGESHPYTCSGVCAGSSGIILACDDESAARMTESWVACASYEPTMIPAEPIDAIAICLDCRNPVDPRHLPRTMNLAVGKRHLIQVRLPESIVFGDDSLRGPICPEAEQSTTFCCGQCRRQDVNARIVVCLAHNAVALDDTDGSSRSAKKHSGKIAETIMTRVACASCDYTFTEGTLPARIVIAGQFEWTIAVQLGIAIPPLARESLSATEYVVTQHADLLIAENKPTAAKCLIGRLICMLNSEAARLSIANKSGHIHAERWDMAAGLQLCARELQQRYQSAGDQQRNKSTICQEVSP